jgi:hypothetical protein
LGDPKNQAKYLPNAIDGGVDAQTRAMEEANSEVADHREVSECFLP